MEENRGTVNVGGKLFNESSIEISDNNNPHIPNRHRASTIEDRDSVFSEQSSDHGDDLPSSGFYSSERNSMMSTTSSILEIDPESLPPSIRNVNSQPKNTSVTITSEHDITTSTNYVITNKEQRYRLARDVPKSANFNVDDDDYQPTYMDTPPYTTSPPLNVLP
eukprot:UN25804